MLRKFYRLLASCVALSVVGISGTLPAFAAEPTVCRHSDPANLTDAQLTQEIFYLIAGSPSSCDVVELWGTDRIMLTSNLAIDGASFPIWDVTVRSAENEHVTLDATNATLGASPGSAFYLTGTDAILRLENLTIENATNSAIFAEETWMEVHLKNVTFRSNSSPSNGGAINTPGEVFLTGSNSFLSNSAVGAGGAIYAGSGVSGAGSSALFTGNTAAGTSGGGAVWTAQDISFAQVVATNNRATKVGIGADGGVFYGRSLYVSGEADFSMNSATGDGGVGSFYQNVTLGSVVIENSESGGDGGSFEVVGNFSVLGSALVRTSRAGTGSTDDGGIVNAVGNVSFGSLDAADVSAGGSGGAIAAVGNSDPAVSVAGALTIRRATAGANGGVISSARDVSIVSLDVEYCTAGQSGGVIHAGGGGDITIGSDASITEARATSYMGGAFYADGSVVVNGNYSSDGTRAGDKGGSVASSSLVEIKGTTTITDSTSTLSGGAIYGRAGITLGSGSISNSHSTSGAAGGLYAWQGPVLVKGDFTFSGNTGGMGGAIYSDQDATFEADVTFKDNVASQSGGAIHAFRGSVDIDGTGTFLRNQATGQGGAVFAFNSLTANNLVMTENSSGNYGGGISLFNGLVDITGNARFTSNTAVAGGGAISAPGNSLLNTAQFVSNRATAGPGGAVITFAGTLSATGLVEFDSNSASSVGGAVSGNVDLPLARFENNSSAVAGGAIFGTDVTIGSGSRFSKNDSAGDGGAVVYFGDAVFTGVGFDENTAAGDGGAISGRTKPLFIYRSSFFGNSSAGVAGAVNADGPVLIRDSYFAHNEATGSATTVAGAVMSGDAAELIFSTFQENASEAQVEIAAGHINAVGNVIVSNSAQHIAAGTMGYSMGNVYSGLAPSTLEDKTSLGAAEIGLATPALDSSLGLGLYTTSLAANSLARDTVTREMFIDAEASNFQTLQMNIELNQVLTNFSNLKDLQGVLRPVGSMDSGAFEYLPPPPPVPYSGPLLFVNLVYGEFAPGDKILLTGARLTSITGAKLGGISAVVNVLSDTSLELTVPEISAGEYELEIQSSSGSLRIQSPIRVVERVAAVAEPYEGPQIIVKHITTGTAKVWAKNIVGQGKVQFFVNGREIAWVRAADSTDPKLRFANNSYYLVRTVYLVAGKNTIEIFVEGERLKRVSYGG